MVPATADRLGGAGRGTPDTSALDPPLISGPTRAVAVGAFHIAATATTLVLCVIIVPIARCRSVLRRRRGLLPRIMWGPIPIINIRYSVLADRLYGYQSESVVYDVYGINTRHDFDHVLDRYRRLPLIGPALPYATFLWALLQYDIFGLFFDGGLLAWTPSWRMELPLLKLSGKRIVAYPYGSDARLASSTRALGPWNAYTDVPEGEEDRDEAEVRKRLKAFGRYADVMLGCNDLVTDLPRCDGILPYPFPTEQWQPVEMVDDGVVTVVHASNHRHFKGTRFVIEAVDRLRAEGLEIELVLVEGMPLEKAREIYERADIVATDFLIGGYALAAIEAMALGKPVIAYMPERLRALHPEWEGVPIVHADPENLVDALRALVLDASLRIELGREGPPYVKRVHGLEAVGARMDAIYRELWQLPAPPHNRPAIRPLESSPAPSDRASRRNVPAPRPDSPGSR